MKILVEFQVNELDLQKAVAMISSGQNVTAAQVINDLFRNHETLPIVFDYDKVTEESERLFHLTGMAAQYITMAISMEEAAKREAEKPGKIITLNS